MNFLKAVLASCLGVFVAFIAVGVLAIAVFSAIIAGATSREHVAVADNSLLVVNLDESIGEFRNEGPLDIFSQEQGTLRELVDALRRAKGDTKIRGVWLKTDGYGGDWAQAEELRAALVELKSAGKFMYATGGDHGFGERDYFVASVADSIVIGPAGMLEMNGITATLTYFKPLLQKLGIKPIVVRAGTYKSAVEPFILDSASRESREMTESLIGSIFDRFLVTVASARKIDTATLGRHLQSDPLMMAEDARRLGFVDAIMYHDQIVSTLRRRLGLDSSDVLPEVTLDDYRASLVTDPGEGSGRIAMVYAVGTISSGESDYSPDPLFGGETVGSATFIESMEEARESPSVKAVVIRVDSPGGDAAASEEMWRQVVLTRAKKPVIVSMGSVAASGGYFIAAAADTIVADASTLTGSIGVFHLGFNMKDFFEKTLGVNMQTIETHEHADMLSAVRDPSDFERAIIERSIDSVYRVFRRIVSEGRKLPLDRVDSLAQGRVWTGEQAKAQGLVDVIGGVNDAIAIAARRVGLGKDAPIRIFPRPRSWIESLSHAFGRAGVSIFSNSEEVRLRRLVESLARQRGIQARMVPINLD